MHSWTVGQRCHIGGVPSAYYVARLCPRTQRITVVAGQHHPALYWRTLYTDAPHWVCQGPPLWAAASARGKQPPIARCLFKTQHRNGLAWCTARLEDSAVGGPEQPRTGLTVTLDEHHRAIAIGQFLVLYGEDGECYGSAKILGLGPSLHDEQERQQQHQARSHLGGES